jgi:hypothetical protein
MYNRRKARKPRPVLALLGMDEDGELYFRRVEIFRVNKAGSRDIEKQSVGEFVPFSFDRSIHFDPLPCRKIRLS